MKNGKKITLILIVLVVGAVAGKFFSISQDKEVEVKGYFSENDVSSADEITCTYPQTLYANYMNDSVSHGLPKPETNPIIFTFTELENSVQGQLSYIDATRTITTVPIVKLIDNEEKFVYIDGVGDNYVTVHTLYKKTGVSTYAKNVQILGFPSATLAMGTCVGY